jgi:hypothetical protein
MKLSSREIDEILSTPAIRAQAKAVFDYCIHDHSFFKFHAEKLQPTVALVLETIKKNYPDLNIPFHSRWGHFRAGGIDRTKLLDAKLAGLSKIEIARAKLDLVITSVLLDAGAGSQWKYREGDKTFDRSEGLGVASFHMFLAGAMSKNKSLSADAEGLSQLKESDIEKHFQVSAQNPLVGVNGRLKLLNNLAEALQNKKIFKDSRPGNILDYLSEKHGQNIRAGALLRAVLDGLGPIWPGRLSASDGTKTVNLGDVWEHSTLGLVPIHKLSQWMTYSLIEPIEEAGFKVTGVEELTGLAEYRNGGLMIDTGLITLKDAENATKAWRPDSDLIIEWRALTLYLLDLIGGAVQKALGKSPQEFPLAKVLEGGTWWAGRALAAKLREGSAPPLNIESDGTVF